MKLDIYEVDLSLGTLNMLDVCDTTVCIAHFRYYELCHRCPL